MQPLKVALPDELEHWRGTAAELADKLNEVLATVPSLRDDVSAANERLVRHYVQVGILTAPAREGREALFGLRQVVEFLAARWLLKDGWPLAKIAELVKTTGLEGLAQLIPSDRPRTRAEEVAARYRPGKRDDVAAANRPSSQRATASRSAGIPASAGAFARTPLSSPLAHAADISRRRASLTENLKALGNAEGRTQRRRIVRIELAPWCHVDVDLDRLDELEADTPATLGAALVQALQEEQLQKGKTR